MTDMSHSRDLTYNQNNRLIRVEEDSVVLGDYIYNSLGQRIWKTVSGVTTTIFHYDFDGNIIAESDENGAFSKDYIYLGQNRLSMINVATGDRYDYGNDRLGTPQIMTDSGNNVVWEGVYKPFGEADVNPNSIVVNNFRFPGQYYDQETGLHYNYHRYYESQTGKFISPDLIGLIGGVNLYTYIENNPINSSDPSGLDEYYSPNMEYLFSTTTKTNNVHVQSKWGIAFFGIGVVDSDTFHSMVAIIKAESSGNILESAAMANVILNRANHTGRSIVDIIKNTKFDGIHTLTYEETYGNKSNCDPSIIELRNIVMNALQGGHDFSNGAYFWEGDYFLKQSSNYFNKRMAPNNSIFIETVHYGKTTFIRYNPEHSKFGNNIYP